MIDKTSIETGVVNAGDIPASALDAFYKEIDALKTEEEKTKKTRDFAVDFTNNEVFTVQDLKEEDMKMWEMVKHPENGIVSKEDFMQYRERVTASANPTRSRFVQFMAGKLSTVWGREELKRFRKVA